MSDIASSTKANDLYENLAPESDFPSIVSDLTGADYQLPTKVDNDLYNATSRITIPEFTQRDEDTAEGSGVFDEFMASIKAHLSDEFENNRITGQEYTKAYIELTSLAMSSAMQFLFQRETVFHQNALVQMQARAAEIQAVTAAAQLEEQKIAVTLANYQALGARASYALTKMQLSTECVNFQRIEKEIIRVVAETTATSYRNIHILPEEQRQIAANADKAEFEVNEIMPHQRNSLDRDVSIKDYQLSNTLPKQYDLLCEQVEVQRAQTQDTRVDGATEIAGAIGRQKALYAQQITSYERDSQYKVAKMYLDAWITQKSLDEGLSAPSQLVNQEINEVLAKIRLDHNLGS